MARRSPALLGCDHDDTTTGVLANGSQAPRNSVLVAAPVAQCSVVLSLPSTVLAELRRLHSPVSQMPRREVYMLGVGIDDMPPNSVLIAVRFDNGLPYAIGLHRGDKTWDTVIRAVANSAHVHVKDR